MTAGKTMRLMQLINVLQTASRHLTADEVREKVAGYSTSHESFQRTFERDKDALRTMGVVLDMGDVPGLAEPRVGYRILEKDFALTDPGLEPDEREALHLAAAAVNAGEHGQLALMKLGAGVASESAGIEIPADEGLATAFSAVVERRLLTFRYGDVDRSVRPHRLQFSRGRWYLIGFDEGRGEIRNYRLSRVVGPISAGTEANAFEPHEGPVEGVTMTPWMLHHDPDPITAEVWFDPAVASTVRGELGADGKVVRDDDEGIVVQIPVSYVDGFRSWVLSYLERAEVLGPPSLRQQIVDWLTEAAAHG